MTHEGWYAIKQKTKAKTNKQKELQKETQKMKYLFIKTMRNTQQYIFRTWAEYFGNKNTNTKTKAYLSYININDNTQNTRYNHDDGFCLHVMF